ncbi:hypothetical protein EHI8A_048800 [Entamoeba histolytica HM-1:IMSS-B]|uniref:Uncharacterized protein n=6 Tax=Entamoeba histolytica TaxID=5759 RepID=C4M9T5_ENTH1|nr:hypothetical protein EHI_056700 [Entamoeba histolytica HM-1:IMSS]EMD45821.1 Hypothetical protein EHI5A_049130 [Entamoeba histolytica KU27]EMH78252.1 hypothetical protein EHI8A_048800 [Entamoeba histolytica HM-1:IMSS-B]EMS13812.1 hypothetical protein KM1_056550 [Entamoeba histolytica HM-3:IMSS]ENY60557.1 hypothetical protein EHI7A_025250 [Entamoeba histolytica HM-1:IMSS-A]GAT98482.1 hypothetical protein CL6EHI_056700 [Entamoeba histolytica]|eukprot:XP_649090.1 hypothetical protein EHI_056700 [Entamoeba histolytica HM-1:IMSS]
MSTPNSLPPKPLHLAPQPRRPNKAAPVPKKKHVHQQPPTLKDVFDDDMTLVIDDRPSIRRKPTSSAGDLLSPNSGNSPCKSTASTPRSENVLFNSSLERGSESSSLISPRGISQTTLINGRHSSHEDLPEHTSVVPSRAAPRPVKHLVQQTTTAKSFSPSIGLPSSIIDEPPYSPKDSGNCMSFAQPPPSKLKVGSNQQTCAAPIPPSISKTQIIMSSTMAASSPNSCASPKSTGSVSSLSQLNAITPPSDSSPSVNVASPPPVSPRSNAYIVTAPMSPSPKGTVLIAAPPPSCTKPTVSIAAPPPPMNKSSVTVAAPPPPMHKVSIALAVPPPISSSTSVSQSTSLNTSTLISTSPSNKTTNQVKIENNNIQTNNKIVTRPARDISLNDNCYHITPMEKFNTQLPHKFIKKPFKIPTINILIKGDENDEKVIELLDKLGEINTIQETQQQEIEEFGLEPISYTEFDTLICVKGNSTELSSTCCIGDSMLVSY